MTVGIDACLQSIEGGIYDIEVSNYNGDIHSIDFFDAAIIISLFAERRANESEVPVASMRRGWIGNEETPGFEIGSKIWIYEQARLTRTVLNGLVDAARQSLQWMVDGGYALSIDKVEAVVTTTGVGLSLTIRRPNSKVEKRYYTLWDNTAIPCENLPRLIEFKHAAGNDAINLFVAAGSPNYPVDVIFTMADSTTIAESTKFGIDTGVGWHKDTTITIVIGTSAVVLGSGGQGGVSAGDYEGTVSRGGGGGGGAPFGLGGIGPYPDDGVVDGDPGGISLGGAGSIGSNGGWGATEDTLAGDGQDGYAAINLQHDVTIMNHGSIIGGAGGGGGGHQSNGTGGDGGSVAGGVGDEGESGPPVSGVGGVRGPAVKTNGYNISWIVTGTVTGDIN